MKKTAMMVAVLALASLGLVGCMSDNKAWLRAKELELKAEKQSAQSARTTVDGPAEVKLEQGGKLTFEAGR
jgi:hypothetical protein